MKQFATKHATTIGMALGLATTLWAAFEALVHSGQPITIATVAAAVGPALVTYLLKRPGDLTRTQAEQLADKRASEALRSVSMAPAENPHDPRD